ncbi:hypothetical protein A3A05_00275 [Candidatus Nomurabacteria bacterium RIFCSPLOWO2_01_FULL_41_12]|uniref:DUF192 domain-containing protein n=1 Tax=Candidatus Nomurabacteria bacterium RIFCSPLOWO2_01_FULL_41_12 TaxID=1801774 RepID=A0A1F6WVN4_9BACT|nr:MAG: hypothetical protein A3A05_00275 [Candidatus Nomurabacteria bacterium RIFCSPLOWO2_01_FULL_41_12]
MDRQKIQKSFALVIIIFTIGFFLINRPSENLKPTEIKYIKIAGTSIKFDLASTPLTQAQGLSGRIKMGEGEGMLFIFEKPGKYYFWMKDMNFPIDMIWIGEDMRVIYIKKNAQPESFPKTYGPDIDSKYVLEVVAGFSEKNNLKEGDRAEF